MFLNFSRPRRSGPRPPTDAEVLPVPWAIAVETLKEARDLITALESAGARRVGVAVDWGCRLYVRWVD
jgi:hypothetical protein